METTTGSDQRINHSRDEIARIITALVVAMEVLYQLRMLYLDTTVTWICCKTVYILRSKHRFFINTRKLGIVHVNNRRLLRLRFTFSNQKTNADCIEWQKIERW